MSDTAEVAGAGRHEIDSALQDLATRFSGEIGFAAKNLATGEQVLLAADRALPTASVIKLSILAEVFRLRHAGQLDLDERIEIGAADITLGSGVLKTLAPGLRPTVHDLATLMVVVSDNTATNMLIDRVGGVDPINRATRELGLPTIVLHNRLDFDVIGDDVRRLGEGSARDFARFIELLVRGEVVSAEDSRAMVDILRRQQYVDQAARFVAFNPYAKELKMQQPIAFASKTGFMPATRADAGAFLLPGDVTISYCAMTERSADLSMGYENEGAIVNGLLGRLVVAHWWPPEAGRPPLLPTNHLDRLTGRDRTA
jgi:beta-lactamase class A